MFERQNREAVGEDADDNRGHAVQQISRIAHDEGGGGAAKFRKVDGAEKTDRYADQRGQQKQLGAAEDGVGHAPARFAYRSRQLGKEAPANGSSAMEDQIAEDEKEHGDGDRSTNTGHRKHESAHEFSPAQPGDQ